MTVAMDDKGGDDRNTMMIEIARTTPVVKIMVVPMRLMTMVMAIMGRQL